ncbi:Uncharacterised protein [Escherichia coli]|uniref:Uncharacterized protein n=1 Tax=Escherichia coli TaxID=562 RepID=A0AAX2KLE7_ECOLX|nr:Uncharacterised protein [Escherichia coli]
MSNTARLQLGFSPLSKTIVLAKMRDLGDGTKRRVGNDRGRDVTNEAAQLVWHLVMAEGGEINWELDDGSRMVLKAEKQEPPTVNIDTTITIDTALNTGLALLGWLYIMSRTWGWLGSIFLKEWKKRRKQELRQKALEAFYDAFELSRIEPGTTARIATKGDLMIVMFRQEKTK